MAEQTARDRAVTAEDPYDLARRYRQEKLREGLRAAGYFMGGSNISNRIGASPEDQQTVATLSALGAARTNAEQARRAALVETDPDRFREAMAHYAKLMGEVAGVVKQFAQSNTEGSSTRLRATAEAFGRVQNDIEGTLELTADLRTKATALAAEITTRMGPTAAAAEQLAETDLGALLAERLSDVPDGSKGVFLDEVMHAAGGTILPAINTAREDPALRILLQQDQRATIKDMADARATLAGHQPILDAVGALTAGPGSVQAALGRVVGVAEPATSAAAAIIQEATPEGQQTKIRGINAEFGELPALTPEEVQQQRGAQERLAQVGKKRSQVMREWLTQREDYQKKLAEAGPSGAVNTDRFFKDYLRESIQGRDSRVAAAAAAAAARPCAAIG